MILGNAVRLGGALGLVDVFEVFRGGEKVAARRGRQRAGARDRHGEQRSFEAGLAPDVVPARRQSNRLDVMLHAKARLDLRVAAQDHDAGGLLRLFGQTPKLGGAREITAQLRSSRGLDAPPATRKELEEPIKDAQAR